MFDFIIVGAGFAGAVLAERLASQKGKRVLVIEKRHHIGGNCYDHFDTNGVLIHRYGPHLFHTSNQEVFHYLSQFTEWLAYHHHVLGFIDGHLAPIPFNLNTLDILFPRSLAASLERKLIDHFGMGKKIPILTLKEEKDEDLKYLADFIYDKMFVNYTSKQWGCKPEEISPEVTARVPVHISRDNRYFHDNYQAIPKHGFTKIFENMLMRPNISLMLNTNYKTIVNVDSKRNKIELFGSEFHGQLIYTGLIDELFEFKFGELPYRSLQFQFEHHNKPFYQETTTINYPNDYDYTRISEFKYITQQAINSTTIVKEYPQDYDRSDPEKNIPYYPVFNDLNAKKYQQYLDFAKQFKNIHLVGRLAEYRYYDMDDIVERALQVFAERFA